MRKYAILVLFWVLSVTASAQHDGALERTWTRPINFQWEDSFAGEVDSMDAFTLPAGGFIERTYWRVDTVTTGVDSVQLRCGPSQIVIATFIPSVDGKVGDIQFRIPNHPAYAEEPLRLIYYGIPDPAGQIRAIIVFRELN